MERPRKLASRLPSWRTSFLIASVVAASVSIRPPIVGRGTAEAAPQSTASDVAPTHTIAFEEGRLGPGGDAALRDVARSHREDPGRTLRVETCEVLPGSRRTEGARVRDYLRWLGAPSDRMTVAVRKKDHPSCGVRHEGGLRTVDLFVQPSEAGARGGPSRPAPEVPGAAVSLELLDFLHDGLRIRWEGDHGIGHWARVRENALYLAEKTGADPTVAELFAALHDSCRDGEGLDGGHGRRAAVLARKLDAEGRLFELPPALLGVLCTALDGHTVGRVAPDPTVATCWDADRLDYQRFHATVDRTLLLTSVARRPEVIEWALRRARHGYILPPP